jgi:hypothetical protein
MLHKGNRMASYDSITPLFPATGKYFPNQQVYYCREGGFQLNHLCVRNLKCQSKKENKNN